MANFDVSGEWVILLQLEEAHAKKAAYDLSRYIGLLASDDRNSAAKAPTIIDASEPAPDEDAPIIVLNCAKGDYTRNGFSWRTSPKRIEIYGDSGRGLSNGIYSFLAALGISWPSPGQELLPLKDATNPALFRLINKNAYEPSPKDDKDAASIISSNLRRFVPADMAAARKILEKSETFAVWAARRRYDAIVLPLKAFSNGSLDRKIKQLKQYACEFGIEVEAGGHDLSSLVPRSYFFLHKDLFRMAEGKREKDHHFCPTCPGVVSLMGKEGKKLFLAAKDTKVIHLWPDKGAETTWCACPTCRAFAPAEQNRIGVNAAADILAEVNPNALIGYFEKPGEGGNIPLRNNLVKIETLPDEKEYP